ncbi:MAG: FAD-dependent oxidoreductase [Acidobacteriota bacterium]|nr:FAD-dependent oxidoreductase [Acidobacteriota bacterium]
MKIAVVGTGISGLTAAHKLYKDHDLTLFEAADYVGGHTNTIDVDLGDRCYAVDTGFIVFNYKTYPNFTKLLDELGVEDQTTSMSFSVKCEKTGLEYNGTNLDTLFAQRRNLFRPSFWGMIREILRFNKQVKEWLTGPDPDPELTLGRFLRDGRYSRELVDHYIVPMGAAVWSAGRQIMEAFPLLFFARFFNNHGMLNVNDRPQWRVIKGGSGTYVRKMIEPFVRDIQLKTPVTSIMRDKEGVMLTTPDKIHRFDQVILSVHADQALRLLNDPSPAEREILSALPYSKNEAVLHTDHTVLPKRKKAWAAWNYHLSGRASERVAVTYDMNILQGIQAPETFCVTLNYDGAIDPGKVIKRIAYEHPIFSVEGMRAQERVPEINGVNNTWFCGAWCFYGFHEDGVRSGLRVAEGIAEQDVVKYSTRKVSV